MIEHGAKKIYATARDISTLEDLTGKHQGRVIPVKLDLHDSKSVDALIATVGDTDLLINNAGKGRQQLASFKILFFIGHTRMP